MKAAFLDFTKRFMLLVMVCMIPWQGVNANPVEDLAWVIDEQQYLSIKVTTGITHLLAESARNRNIYVRVLILNRQGENLKEIINQEVIGLKNKIPSSLQEKTTFFIINLATNKSTIILGDALEKTDPLYQSLGVIEQKIVLPLLDEGQIDNAIIQGVAALTTVLEGEPEKNAPFFLQKVYVWLSNIVK